MTLGEKLYKARKDNNITQEQLADTLGVSRQAVSKWESDVAYPETDKLVKMSELFNCSLDYLLKESNSDEPVADGHISEKLTNGRTVTVEQAERFLEIKRRSRKLVAFATALCILSPICLFLLAGLTEKAGSGVTDGIVVGIGLPVLLVMIAAAVAMFIFSGKCSEEFAFLEKEPISVSPELKEFASNKKTALSNAYMAVNIIATVLCIMSVIPLFIGVWLFENDGFMIIIMLCIMLVIVAAAVFMFIYVGIPWANLQKLLQEGEYSVENKKTVGFRSAVVAAYWTVATVIYLISSFVSNRWNLTWIVWAAAGVLFPVVLWIIRTIANKGIK